MKFHCPLFSSLSKHIKTNAVQVTRMDPLPAQVAVSRYEAKHLLKQEATDKRFASLEQMLNSVKACRVRGTH